MKRLLSFSYAFLIGSFTAIYCQNTPVQKSINAINRNVLESQLGFLASDWMEGRRAGEKGELISSDYIASMLQLYGVKPAGDVLTAVNLTKDASLAEKSWFQNIVLLKTSPGTEQVLKLKSIDGNLTRTTDFTYNIDYTIRPVSGMEIEAPVVFAGYGFKNDKLKINDFSKLDVKGKFILKITGFPAFAIEKLTSDEIYASRRDFEEFARKEGAAGIIEINPGMRLSQPLKDFQNMSPSENNPNPSDSYARYSLPGITTENTLIRLTVTPSTAAEILRGTANSADEYIKKADLNQAYSLMPINGKTLILRTTVTRSSVNVRNVIGVIEGKKADQFIVLGAHYDHMGMNRGYIWNGADDNGSGTVGVMTIAKAIMETGIKPEKSIIVALWTAEEEGLLGSHYFVNNPTIPKKNIKMNVNFDMISRYIADDQPNKVVMTYTDTYKIFKDITVSNLIKYNIDLDVSYQPSSDPPGGTDHRSFVEAGFPIMRFKPGHREEYHTPADELSTIDWGIMEKIVKISFANVWELANSEW
jgi:hypothetical protein